MIPKPERREWVLDPRRDDAAISHELGTVLARPAPLAWWLGFVLSGLGALLFFGTAAALFTAGVGLWGINTTVVWGFDIINYVWWIGIGNAGTLISAMLYLTRQPWRTSINRFAEAMTLFAASIAGLFPIMHMGRPYLFYWLAPYPSVMGVAPQFRSPLVWDMFAILTYILVSALFWYAGLIPDLATLRDRASGLGARRAYGILALGWRGSARHWQRYEQAYTLMAGLAVPLVVSVHSVVGYDFSTSIMPGWRSTLFAPFFVVGAMFSGFAMVVLISLALRRALNLGAYIRPTHLDAMAKILLAAAWLMGYAYGMELFAAWYQGDPDEQRAMRHNLYGPYAAAYWGMLSCNVLAPQVFWWPLARRCVPALIGVALLVCFGMWLERFVIVVSGLSQGYVPSQFRLYAPTFWDWTALLGSFGLFLWLFLLAARFLPMLPLHELRRLHREQAQEAPP